MEIKSKIYKTLTVLSAVGMLFGMGKTPYHENQRNLLQKIPEVKQTLKLKSTVNNLEKKLNITGEFENPRAETIYRYALQIEYGDQKKEYNAMMAKPEIKQAMINVEKHEQAKGLWFLVFLGSVPSFCIGALGWSNNYSRKRKELESEELKEKSKEVEEKTKELSEEIRRVPKELEDIFK